MKIVDNQAHAMVKSYGVGDVVQDDSSTYMIVQTDQGDYTVVDLADGTATGTFSGLDELYSETHRAGERKVIATVMIERDAV
ncbi:hypothetical protein [Levilactobacillus acidifarinae]|uniref:Uncharacterized protein n=1 Tax=Levilactobacillus acidifarinae DSM 19394 = JCM 15949 TaxID=1423715 RepID=A0A0R1LNG2_9LACO|nr:hypothetical protein [Levilactobacillus acidifarinae]KRK94233.1 hypothetical protein FD25_GL000185 [Levilactobacillus acidifarinae DSM 19394]GEO70521.1 hypothetical protein LAC03_24310 [Levilactobacillus acidifarinae]